jgi:riboflavin synthase
MFTGIIEELGEVLGLVTATDSGVLTVRTKVVGLDVRHGASIAVNGVCLTVIDAQPSTAGRDLSFDVMGETLLRSDIGALAPGDQVNLERAIRVDGRLDGHVVQGHVDAASSVVSRTAGDAWETLRFALPDKIARYVAEKGSIAVDGVSLTVSALGDGWFEVGLIPETLRATTLGTKRPGDAINLEVDVLAKYAERLMMPGVPR